MLHRRFERRNSRRDKQLNFWIMCTETRSKKWKNGRFIPPLDHHSILHSKRTIDLELSWPSIKLKISFHSNVLTLLNCQANSAEKCTDITSSSSEGKHSDLYWHLFCSYSSSLVRKRRSNLYLHCSERHKWHVIDSSSCLFSRNPDSPALLQSNVGIQTFLLV